MCTVPLWLNILSRELEEVMEPLWAIPSTPPLIPEPVEGALQESPWSLKFAAFYMSFSFKILVFCFILNFIFFCFILKNTSEINKNTTHQRATNSRVKKKIYFLYLSLLFVSVLLCVLFLPCFKRGCFYDNNLEHPSLLWNVRRVPLLGEQTALSADCCSSLARGVLTWMDSFWGRFSAFILAPRRPPVPLDCCSIAHAPAFRREHLSTFKL